MLHPTCPAVGCALFKGWVVYSCPLLLPSLVEFHPDISRLQLFSSSIDYKIRIWDLNSSKCVAVLDGHFSAVTSLAFADGNTLLRYLLAGLEPPSVHLLQD